MWISRNWWTVMSACTPSVTKASSSRPNRPTDSATRFPSAVVCFLRRISHFNSGFLNSSHRLALCVCPEFYSSVQPIWSFHADRSPDSHDGVCRHLLSVTRGCRAHRRRADSSRLLSFPGGSWGDDYLHLRR